MKILGVLFVIAGFILFAQYQIPAALISILIGSFFLAYPTNKKKKPEEEAEDSSPGEIVQVDTPLQKVRNIGTAHRRLAFPVDGVTELNDDGSSRQQILQTLCDGDSMSVAEVWFDDFVLGGKFSIRVMTEAGCVGQIRQKDVYTVRSYFGKAVRMIYLEINSKKTENDSDVYLADVVIIEGTEPDA